MYNRARVSIPLQDRSELDQFSSQMFWRTDSLCSEGEGPYQGKLPACVTVTVPPRVQTSGCWLPINGP